MIELSICMIVKDEEKNLKRCLDSFFPIFNEDWCELVITDTGSKDRTVEIAKKYTDKVYFHKWQDDFSKARNACMKHAIGRRVFTVDADEELPMTCWEPLRRLIANQDYDKPTIFIKINNIYAREMGELFTDFIQPRIFHREGFRYTRAKHNRPMHKTPYVIADKIYLNHYGYKFQGDPELMEKKRERTVPHLYKLYKKDNNDIHNVVHLTKSCRTMKDMDSIIYFGEKFVELMKDVYYTEGWFAYLEVFVSLVMAYIKKGDLENAFRIYEESKKYSDRIAEIPMLFGSYYSGQDNEKARYYYEKVIEIKSVKGSEYEKLLTSNLKMIMPTILNFLSIYYYQHGDYKKAGEYMNQGIILNNNRIGIRWDIFNCKELGRGILAQSAKSDYINLLEKKNARKNPE